ncbi:site-specific integrase [Elizabethkingia anophelis]|nr:site-specific integrase [Elizabethkingia anophelis]
MKEGKLISDNAPIFLRLTYNGNRINLFSGYRCDLKNWNLSLKEVKSGAVNLNGETAETINFKIAKYKADLNTFFLENQIKDTIPSIEETKNAYEIIRNGFKPEKEIKKKTAKKTVLKFYEVFDEFTSYNGKINNWTDDTYTKFATLKSHLQAFNPNLKFSDLTLEGLSEVLSFFTRELKLRNTTTKKYIENIKWFLRYAIKKNYTDNNAFEDFNPKLKIAKKKLIFLTEDEINQIRKLEIPETKQYLDRVRDVLIFLSYTGLRHSDAYKLRRSDIKDGKIEITTQKTIDSLTIELNNTAQEILDKYKDIPFKDDKALPVISNQNMNDYLKELGELAEINEPITETFFIGNQRHDETKPKYEYLGSHVGRRTFVCLCIAKGIGLQIIMKWTGHSDYKSMKPYIEVADSTKEVEMQKLNF